MMVTEAVPWFLFHSSGIGTLRGEIICLGLCDCCTVKLLCIRVLNHQGLLPLATVQKFCSETDIAFLRSWFSSLRQCSSSVAKVLVSLKWFGMVAVGLRWVCVINAGTCTALWHSVSVSFFQSGVLSSLPFIAGASCTILGGQMADFLLSRNHLSLITVRKLFSSLGKDRGVDSGNYPLLAWGFLTVCLFSRAPSSIPLCCGPAFCDFQLHSNHCFADTHSWDQQFVWLRVHHQHPRCCPQVRASLLPSSNPQSTGRSQLSMSMCKACLLLTCTKSRRSDR